MASTPLPSEPANLRTSKSKAEELDARHVPPAQVLIETKFDPRGGWTILVTDNGSGISPEDRERVFSLFESSKGARGTGLGLPVSEKIMREHGGHISIHDAPTPPGTCFALHLPPTGTDPSATVMLGGSETKSTRIEIPSLVSRK
jgi:nitrogen fixation/metabolism regulation signal transduction histidine kinase